MHLDLTWLSKMLVMGEPLLDKILRPIVVYAFLVVCLRIFGKRELAQLNPFDLVVLLSLSNTVQNAIIGDDVSVTGGLVGAFTLLAVNYGVVRFLFRHRRLDEMLEGTPTTLIEEGGVNRSGLARELMTESELLTVLHRQGFARVDEIEKCILEPGGTIFVQGRQPRENERLQRQVMDALRALHDDVTALRREIAHREA